jgi:hypothetical protein
MTCFKVPMHAVGRKEAFLLQCTKKRPDFRPVSFELKLSYCCCNRKNISCAVVLRDIVPPVGVLGALGTGVQFTPVPRVGVCCSVPATVQLMVMEFPECENVRVLAPPDEVTSPKFRNCATNKRS